MARAMVVSGMVWIFAPLPATQAATITVCPSECDFAGIQSAVDAAMPGDTISIASGSYPGPIAIDKDLTLLGAGADDTRIVGGASVVAVSDNATVGIEGLLLTGGSYTNSNTGDRPSPFYSGGGGLFVFEATVELKNSAVRGNRANGSLINGPDHISTFAIGGGIYVSCGRLTLVNTTVSDNLATGADVDVLSTVFASGRGGNGMGGGIYAVNGQLSIRSSTISGNRATGGDGFGGVGGDGFGGDADGGGIYNLKTIFEICDMNLLEGLVSIQSSTVSDNHAAGGRGVGGDVVTGPKGSSGGFGLGGDVLGGGIFNNNYGGSIGLTNSTLSGNTATGGDACPGRGTGVRGIGGDAAGGGAVSDTIFLDFATLTKNAAIGGRAFGVNCAVGVPEDDGFGSAGAVDLTLNPDNPFFPIQSASESILVDNAPDDCNQAIIVDLGYNLESEAACGFTAPSSLQNAGDLIGLGPLRANGGPTLTHALLSASPAVDAAAESCFPSTDQRGRSRPKDGDGDGEARCDIGAYELVPLLFGDGFESGDTSAWSSVQGL